MNPFDQALIAFYNQFAQRWALFDRFLNLLVGAKLLKGGVLMALFWGAWIAHGRYNDRDEMRTTLLASLLGSTGAVTLARILAHLLPFRPRPAYLASDLFRLPYGTHLDAMGLTDWSSFPSDHAALFSGLAMGLLLVSRRLGAISLLWVLVVISFPRLYLGIHYPTDILGGMILGIASTGVVCLLAQRRHAIKRVCASVVALAQSSPYLFYAGLFLCSFEIADLFDDVRDVLSALVKLWTKQ